MPRYARSTRTRSRKPKPAAKPRRKTGQRKRVTGPFRTYVSNDPFRTSMSVKLAYTKTHAAVTGSGGVFGPEDVIRLASLYDPEFGLGGHQPYGFDQLALLYRKYKVNAVLVELTCTDPSEDGLVIGCTFQPPNGAYTLAGKTPDILKEKPMCVTRPINNTGSQLVRIKQYMPMSKISGLTPLQFKADIDLFTATTSANPTAEPYFRFAVASDRAASGAGLIMRVKVTYFATFYERITLTQS